MSQTREHSTPLNGSSAATRRKDGLLTTGDMARMSGNTLRTVRFYEETGLLSPVQRTDGGHRLFENTELRKLLLVTEMRAAGFSLEEIKTMMEVKEHSASGAVASNDIARRLASQINVMSDRISLLQQLRAELVATQELLARCSECTTDDHFPNACGECDKMHHADELPNALSVLWRVP